MSPQVPTKGWFLILASLVLTAKSKRYDFPEFPNFDDFFSDFWSGNDFEDEIAEASFHNYEHRYGNEFPNGGRKKETLVTVKCMGRKCKSRSVSFPGIIHTEKRHPLEDDDDVSFSSFFPQKWKPSRDDNGYKTFDYWKSGSEQRKVWSKHGNSFRGTNYAKSTNSRHFESIRRNNNEQPVVSGVKSGSGFLAFGSRKKQRDLRDKTPNYSKSRSKNRDIEGREDRKPSINKQDVYFKPHVNFQLLKAKEKQEDKTIKTVERKPPIQKIPCFDSEECDKSQSSGNGSQYYRRNQQGPGSYRFGYRQIQNKDLHYRKEKRESDGQVTGRYGYSLPDGQRREVKYWVDDTGDFHQKTRIL